MSAKLNRREFLGKARNASVGAACCGSLAWLSACATVPFAESSREGDILRVSRTEFDIAPGVLIRIPEDPMPIYLHRHTEVRYSAVLTRCTHQGCEAAPETDRIVCPCHGSQFSFDGRVLQGPAERPLTRYPVSVSGDQILIYMGVGT